MLSTDRQTDKVSTVFPRIVRALRIDRALEKSAQAG